MHNPVVAIQPARALLPARSHPLPPAQGTGYCRLVPCEQRENCRAEARQLSLSGSPATNLGLMMRLAVLVLLFLVVAVPAQAVPANPTVVAQQAQEEPAVVIEDSEGAPEDEAWTFRYLVPTLMVLTLALVVGLVAWYQRGFSGRYRVRE